MSEKKMVPSLYVNDALTLFIKGKPYQILPGHSNYAVVKQAWVDGAGEDELFDLLHMKNALARYVDGKAEVVDGQVYYNGQPVHNVVVDRILQFMEEGLPFEPMLRFLENLMANPNPKSVDLLYKFLENEQLPITEDGCFYAYKGVSSNFLDQYTHTINNAVGQVVSMPREEVVFDPHSHCHRGLHVGSLNYARGYTHGNGHLMVVKVNPKNCVSVPTDTNEKMRVCEYEVVSEYEDVLDAKLYKTPQQKVVVNLDLDTFAENNPRFKESLQELKKQADEAKAMLQQLYSEIEGVEAAEATHKVYPSHPSTPYGIKPDGRRYYNKRKNGKFSK